MTRWGARVTRRRRSSSASQSAGPSSWGPSASSRATMTTATVCLQSWRTGQEQLPAQRGAVSGAVVPVPPRA